MSGIVRIENVSKIFKTEQVLKNVSVEFEEGKIYGIVGKNGSGKTVLFKLIVGFLRPTEGHVYVKDKEVGVDSDYAENIGMIIETPGFLPQYTAYKNLKYLAAIRHIISDEQIKTAIRMVGLDPDDVKKVGKYSLGMRQRLGIAQAIMENPDVVILDEPMNGLDKNGIQIVKDVLLDLKQQGKTIIMASHYVEDTEICDKIYEMDAGEYICPSSCVS